MLRWLHPPQDFRRSSLGLQHLGKEKRLFPLSLFSARDFFFPLDSSIDYHHSKQNAKDENYFSLVINFCSSVWPLYKQFFFVFSIFFLFFGRLKVKEPKIFVVLLQVFSFAKTFNEQWMSLKWFTRGNRQKKRAKRYKELISDVKRRKCTFPSVAILVNINKRRKFIDYYFLNCLVRYFFSMKETLKKINFPSSANPLNSIEAPTVSYATHERREKTTFFPFNQPFGR